MSLGARKRRKKKRSRSRRRPRLHRSAGGGDQRQERLELFLQHWSDGDSPAIGRTYRLQSGGHAQGLGAGSRNDPL